MTDWVLTGVTTESCTYDPQLCLLTSMHNPQRALLKPCVINSNNSRRTDFILISSPGDEDSCFDELEKVMLAKASFRAHQRASRERTVIRYKWPNFTDAVVETAIRLPVPPTCAEYNMDKHRNKFGTPLPARRASKEGTLMDDAFIAKDKLGDRNAERTSNTSVMDFLGGGIAVH